MSLFALLWVLLKVTEVSGLGLTDTVTWGGDNSRASYQDNHNLDPNVIAGPDFGQVFATKLPGNFNDIAPEQVFSAPLVYTGDDGVQYVYISTTQNNLYKLDAKTGKIVAQRNLHVPFLAADLDGCVDINPTVGITATGVIDPDTGIWYVTSKTYSSQFQDGNFGPNNRPGRLNGRYYQHAVHTANLTEVSGWPVMLDGLIFRNNPNRMFIGGNQHSRPAALLVGDYVYTGYASHCVQYNFTGAIIGFNKKTGQIIEAFATEGGPEPNTVKGGGVWMSGGGLAYDGKGSMFFATGNGYASQLRATGNEVPGRTPPSALEEAAVNAKINENGTLSIIDFFMPWEKTQLDGADKDLGTSPLVLLPTDPFSCKVHRRIGVVTGKSGKTYFLDLDNLGGYQMKDDKTDAVIQVWQNENSVYAGAGVLPMNGGYVYIPVTQYSTHVFKFGCLDNGKAEFTKVSDTPDKNAYILGTGHGTTTSMKGKDGTALLWQADVQGGNLRVYDAIPPARGGNLKLLKSYNINGVTKFMRPVFGNGMVYMGSTQGYVYGFGAPVTVPLNCSSPYDFGTVPLGNSSDVLTVKCTATTDTTVTNVSLSDPNFTMFKDYTLPIELGTGEAFSFRAVSSPKTVGAITADIRVSTSNAKPGYSSSTPITLKTNGYSVKPILAIAPNTVSFNAVAGQPSLKQSTLIWNLGGTKLTFENISFSITSEQGPWVKPNKTSGQTQVGKFLFGNLPTSIDGGASTTLDIIYNPDVAGNHAVYIKAFSDGGNAILDVFGVAGTPAKMIIEFEKPDGTGWQPYRPGVPFTFGTVFQSQTKYLNLRISNGGGPNAVPLSITISKPPYGVPGIIGKANNVDLAEGTIIFANQSQTAAMYCAVPKRQVNLPPYNGTATWTLNSGDLELGKQTVEFFCNAASEIVGMIYGGTALYSYVGCFLENNPGRQLRKREYTSIYNDNGYCIKSCYDDGFMFAGTQYVQECWCGDYIPNQIQDELDCNFGCAGAPNQTCGGDGYLHDHPRISLFADRTRFDGNLTVPDKVIPKTVGPFYNFKGCYLDVNGKTIGNRIFENVKMTVELCQQSCGQAQYFGLEYSFECYCGDDINPSRVLLDESECNMICGGDIYEYCGASNRMQVYERISPYSSTSGVVITPSSTSTSTSTSKSSTSSSVATPKSSASTSSSTGSKFSSSSTSAPPPPMPSSAFTCPASNGATYTTNSGNKYRIDCFIDRTDNDIDYIYLDSLEQCISRCDKTPGCAFAAYVASPGNDAPCYLKGSQGSVLSDSRIWGALRIQNSSSSTSKPSSTSTKTSTSTPIPPSTFTPTLTSSSKATSTTTPTITLTATTRSTSSSTTSAVAISSRPPLAGYRYEGCYVDPASQGKGRALKVGPIADTRKMSPKLCATACSSYAYWGVEYSFECWCGPYLNPNATIASNQSDCKSPCVGENSEICGGPSRLSLWYSPDINKIVSDPTWYEIGDEIGNWKYVGCYKDIATPGTTEEKLLSFKMTNDLMTHEFCIDNVQKAGDYAYLGLEYGRECFYGTEPKAVATRNVQVEERECRVDTCAGDRSKYCGASSRIMVWKRNFPVQHG